MPKRKFILEVIYGETASDYAVEKGFSAAKRAINNNTLEGSIAKYEFESEADRKIAEKILEDADGWMGAYFKEKNYHKNTH